MKLSRILYYNCKRYFKKISFWIILLILPILTILLSKSANSESETLNAVVYIEDFDSEIIDSFNNYQGAIHFKICDSEKEVLTLVTTKAAECGYIIPKDFYENILDGNKKEIVTVYTSPSTTLSAMINETVYSLLFPKISSEAVKQYLYKYSSQQEYIEQNISEQEYEELYSKYLTNGSTFHFESTNVPDNYQNQVKNVIISPLRGLLSIFVLLSALVGAIDYYQNINNLVFQNTMMRTSCILIPTFFSGAVAALCLVISPIGDNIIKELLAMTLYMLFCSLFVWILTLIIKKAQTYYAFLPIFILGNLIISPVFFDLARFIPAMKVTEYLFLPTYYLNFFN